MVHTPQMRYVREMSLPKALACLRAVQVTVQATQRKAMQPNTKYPHYSHESANVIVDNQGVQGGHAL